MIGKITKEAIPIETPPIETKGYKITQITFRSPNLFSFEVKQPDGSITIILRRYSRPVYEEDKREVFNPENRPRILQSLLEITPEKSTRKRLRKLRKSITIRKR
jgi:hypothetical protein